MSQPNLFSGSKGKTPARKSKAGDDVAKVFVNGPNAPPAIFTGEEATQVRCWNILKLRWPKVPAMGYSLANIPIGRGDKGNKFYLRNKMKAMGAVPAWPDITIAVGRTIRIATLDGKEEEFRSAGLYLELKHPNGLNPWPNRGGLSIDDHIREQAEFHWTLLQFNSLAMFCIGDRMFETIVERYFRGDLRVILLEVSAGPRASIDKPLKYAIPDWVYSLMQKS